MLLLSCTRTHGEDCNGLSACGVSHRRLATALARVTRATTNISRRHASHHIRSGAGNDAAEARRYRAGGTTVGVTLGVLAGTLVGATGERVRGQGGGRGGRRDGGQGGGRGRGRLRRRQRGQRGAEPLPSDAMVK